MQEGDNSLDNILNDESAEEAAAPVAEATPQPEPEEPGGGPARDEHGRFAAKTGVEETPEPVPPTDKLPQEDYKAIREEREKRQAAEARALALEQQLQSQQEPPAPPPSIWEDEQGWQQHFGSQIAQQAAFNAKLDMSEMMTRQANPDFEDMKGRFLEMAQANPGIVQQALSDPHPWAKAYSIAKNAARMEELGAVDLADLEAKIEARLREEMQGQSPLPNAPQTLPPTLTGERNVGARTGPAWAGPPSLDQLLG